MQAMRQDRNLVEMLATRGAERQERHRRLQPHFLRAEELRRDLCEAELRATLPKTDITFPDGSKLPPP